eukprot:5572839-Alexandrium_andersonii.AAC.1
MGAAPARSYRARSCAKSACAHELQPNGSAENAVEQLKGLARALTLAFQARIQGEAPVDHP